MAMAIQYGVRGMILAAQSEVFKQENVPLLGSEIDEAHASSGLTDSPCGGLLKSLHSGLIISPHSSLIKPLHSDLSGLPCSGLLNPPLSGLIIKPDSGLVSSGLQFGPEFQSFGPLIPIPSLDNMANENVPTPTLTRFDDQFWNTLTQEAKTRVYHFKLDEDWFILNANLLREALEITPIDQAHQFESPPSGDAIMDFVNALGYPEEIHFMLWGIITRTNVDYAELMWEEFVQAIQTFLADKANLGIATKKGKKTKPHAIPYCRFTKLIICYLGRKYNISQRHASPFHLAKEDHRLGNLKFVPKGEEDEVFGMQIPKELITDNIRNAPYYNANLEMVTKHDRKIVAEEGGKKKSATKADQSKKPTTSKQLNPVPSKQSKPSPAKQPNPVKDKSTKPSPIKKAAKAPKPQVDDEEFYLQRGIQMSLESLQVHGQAPVSGVAFCKPGSGITKKLPIVKGKGKGIATDEHVAQSLLELQTYKKTSTTDQCIFQRRILVTEEAPTRPSAQPEDDTSANIVRDT
ncbi:hypothetical protein Tco_0707217 [Tanacetum coccineum]|uniref:Uncharacterized protein n=1 Tax=Tanacetum coccineum TaxID=301880 RepID=A0ABQ4YAN0_9ASTR